MAPKQPGSGGKGKDGGKVIDLRSASPRRPSPGTAEGRAKGGRNRRGTTKFDAVKREAYLAALRTGARRGAAAESVGISRQSVNNYRKAHPEFVREESEAEGEANELVEDALFEAAVSGNTTAIQVWLYNRAPERWQDRRGAREAGALEVGDIAELTDSERKERIKSVLTELRRRAKEA